MQRCLVLGGKGFIGSHLVDALLARGCQVRSFDRPHVSLLPEGASHRPGLEYMDGDFASAADVGAAVEGCDVCFHLISTTLPKSSNADPVFDVETNVMGTVRLLEHAVRQGMRKVVFVSSGGTVYGTPMQLPIDETHPTEPLCSYGITKLAIEKYLHLYQVLHGLEYAVLRLSNPFGERQRVQATQGAVAVFLGRALRGEMIEIWGDGSVVRDYLHIADVIGALLAAAESGAPERLFNIGSGMGLSLNDVLATIEQVLGRPVSRRYLPGRAFDVPVSVLSIARARRVLGWQPQLTFIEGLTRMAKWMQHSGHLR